MDVVWICRTGPNEELRYSIRSVAANMPHENIIVVGGKPDWYTGKFIEVNTFTAGGHLSRNKYENAKNNIRQVVDNDSISKDFVLMNDDFYVMKPVDQVPYYHGGLLADKIRTHQTFAPGAEYTGVLTRTAQVLDAVGIKDPLDYTLHIPMMFNRKKLGEVLKQPIASIRTLYGNMYSVGGRQMGDVKVHPKRNQHAPEPFDYKNEDSIFLSTADSTFSAVKRNLLDLVFPKPSKYEKSGH
jgi:hypothetical protein